MMIVYVKLRVSSLARCTLRWFHCTAQVLPCIHKDSLANTIHSLQHSEGTLALFVRLSAT